MRNPLSIAKKTGRQGDAETRRWAPSPLLTILALITVAAFNACERKITDANLRVIKPDMTTKEVESILGAPNKIETVSEPPAEAVKTLRVTRYVYEQNGKKIELTFVGDRLGSGSDVAKSREVTPVPPSSANPAAFPKRKNEAPAITGTIGK